MKYRVKDYVYFNKQFRPLFAGEEVELTDEELKGCGPKHFEGMDSKAQALIDALLKPKDEPEAKKKPGRKPKAPETSSPEEEAEVDAPPPADEAGEAEEEPEAEEK